jgi:GH25 family lysozyme M1 (1,4-beta-N-acetylmuramidase)
VGKNCTSSVDGKADAERFEKILHGKQFEIPVYIDLEATTPANKKGTTDAVIAFCEYMEKCGYYVGVYASDISGFKDKLDIARLAPYDKWVARYGSAPSYVTQYGMWQCSSTGLVPGIYGNVDIDMAYKDYPTIIKTHKLNGYK